MSHALNFAYLSNYKFPSNRKRSHPVPPVLPPNLANFLQNAPVVPLAEGAPVPVPAPQQAPSTPVAAPVASPSTAAPSIALVPVEPPSKLNISDAFGDMIEDAPLPSLTNLAEPEPAFAATPAPAPAPVVVAPVPTPAPTPIQPIVQQVPFATAPAPQPKPAPVSIAAAFELANVDPFAPTPAPQPVSAPGHFVDPFASTPAPVPAPAPAPVVVAPVQAPVPTPLPFVPMAAAPMPAPTPTPVPAPQPAPVSAAPMTAFAPVPSAVFDDNDIINTTDGFKQVTKKAITVNDQSLENANKALSSINTLKQRLASERISLEAAVATANASNNEVYGKLEQAMSEVYRLQEQLEGLRSQLSVVNESQSKAQVSVGIVVVKYDVCLILSLSLSLSLSIGTTR